MPRELRIDDGVALDGVGFRGRWPRVLRIAPLHGSRPAWQPRRELRVDVSGFFGECVICVEGAAGVQRDPSRQALVSADIIPKLDGLQAEGLGVYWRMVALTLKRSGVGSGVFGLPVPFTDFDGAEGFEVLRSLGLAR